MWLHEDSDGSPWMIVSLDFIEAAVIGRTLRLDFDGKAIRGGWSPASLNRDDGVRADAAEVDTAPPDGIHLQDESVEALAEAAAAWFRLHHSAG